MPGRRNQEDEVLLRRTQVANLYLKGHTQRAIATQLGVSQQQVSHDLAAVRKEWQQSRLKDVDEMKAIELTKIDNLEATYWNAWERSLQAKTKKSKKIRGQAVGDKSTPRDVESTDTTEERLGDPRYLEGIRWCIEKRCKLLGLEAPAMGDGSTFFGWKPEERPPWWRTPGGAAGVPVAA